jgi:GNAT superfamily N-acetyltransferase
MGIAAQRESGVDIQERWDEELRPLAEACRPAPYTYCPVMTAARRVEYVLSSLGAGRERGTVTFVSRSRGRAEGLLQLEELPWDTKILGFRVGRIAWWLSDGSSDASLAREELLRACVRGAERRGLQYLVARVASEDRAGVHILETNGFALIDGLLSYGLDLAKLPTTMLKLEGPLTCAKCAIEDMPALREIARSSFVFDRFHGDPAIPANKADELHQRWIEDSCSGTADAVLVAHAGRPVGFTTLKLDKLAEAACGVGIGNIALVATSADHRRKGIARSLTLAALDWFRKAGCSWVEVGTQMANVAASRVYQSVGFELVGSSLTFRRLLSDGPTSAAQGCGNNGDAPPMEGAGR